MAHILLHFYWLNIMFPIVQLVFLPQNMWLFI
jgi:hypothetical protein